MEDKNNALNAIFSAYCGCEFAIAELNNVTLTENQHTNQVRKNAAQLATRLSDEIMEMGYKIHAYVNSDRRESIIQPDQELLTRGETYFAPLGGGIVFQDEATGKHLTINCDAARLQSGRLQDAQALKYLLKDLSAAIEVLAKPDDNTK